jgi:hypothetical protein
MLLSWELVKLVLFKMGINWIKCIEMEINYCWEVNLMLLKRDLVVLNCLLRTEFFSMSQIQCLNIIKIALFSVFIVFRFSEWPDTSWKPSPWERDTEKWGSSPFHLSLSEQVSGWQEQSDPEPQPQQFMSATPSPQSGHKSCPSLRCTESATSADFVENSSETLLLLWSHIDRIWRQNSSISVVISEAGIYSNSQNVFGRKIWGFHGDDYEEWRLLGCCAVWLL